MLRRRESRTAEAAGGGKAMTTACPPVPKANALCCPDGCLPLGRETGTVRHISVADREGNDSNRPLGATRPLKSDAVVRTFAAESRQINGTRHLLR
jgi:hypothetical protein